MINGHWQGGAVEPAQSLPTSTATTTQPSRSRLLAHPDLLDVRNTTSLTRVNGVVEPSNQADRPSDG
jgi:hypothetical protein